MQVDYGTIKTLYGWWFYHLAIKVIENFKISLNNLHPLIKFISETKHMYKIS